MADEDKEQPDAASSGRGQFAIQKVYIKDLSFETPHSPGIFQEKWDPSVNMDLSNTATSLNDSYYEVVLSITVTVSIDDKTAYLAEVQQAGVFYIRDFPDEAIKHMVATICPNILFPFAREAVSDLVTRGGFPQLLLAPVNFEALYQEQQAQQVEEESGKTKH